MKRVDEPVWCRDPGLRSAGTEGVADLGEEIDLGGTAVLLDLVGLLHVVVGAHQQEQDERSLRKSKK